MGEADRWTNGYAFWKGQYSVRNTIYRMMKDELSKKERALHDSCNGNMSLGVTLFICVHSSSDLTNVIDEEFPDNNIDKSLFEEIQSLKRDINIKFPYGTCSEYPIDIIKDICGDVFPPMINDDSIACIVSQNFRSRSVHYQCEDKYGRAIVSIDLSAETNVIISDIRTLIEEQKNGYGVGDFTDERDLIALKSELCSNGVMYRAGSDESRAVGLLLFDYLEENEASDAEAIRWARKEIADQGLKNFGKADSSDRQFQRWLSNTRRCIEFAEVLEI